MENSSSCVFVEMSHLSLHYYTVTAYSTSVLCFTGASRYVGEAVKEYGTHDLCKRNVVGITSWGAIENHTDLIGKDVSSAPLSLSLTHAL